MTSNLSGEILVALTFDTDNDYFDSSITPTELKSRHLPGWRGIEEGIPLIQEVLSAYVDDFASKPRSTWFVRVDPQLAILYGDAGYLLEKYGVLWQDCLDNGDEIGWHPHLYKMENGKWLQETDDIRLEAALREIYDVIKQKGFVPLSSRMGEAFCSNAVLRTLEELGIHCDSTAMPGRIRKDGERNLDWKTTSQEPYYPSRFDYRRPGHDSLNLLEVPMSMAKTRAEYDTQPLLRYVDLSFYHETIKDGLRVYLNHANILVTVTHPSTVLPGITNHRHGLLSFDIQEFKKNLDYIFSECRRLGKMCRFITIGDCWNLFRNKPQKREEES